jgi:hypothetical protein
LRFVVQEATTKDQSDQSHKNSQGFIKEKFNIPSLHSIGTLFSSAAPAEVFTKFSVATTTGHAVASSWSWSSHSLARPLFEVVASDIVVVLISFNSPSAQNSNISGSYLVGNTITLVSVIVVISPPDTTIVATSNQTYQLVLASFLKVLSA